jgi:hypothetical protein
MCVLTQYRNQSVIKDKIIEGVIVRAWVCLRNMCRVMKMPVVQEGDRDEIDLEAKQFGPLLDTLISALRKKKTGLFAAAVASSNNLANDEGADG